MRPSPARFASLAVLAATVAACNSIFGISDGTSGVGGSTTGTGGTGGTGGTTSSSSSGTATSSSSSGTGGTASSSSSGTGGVSSSSSSSSSSGTGDGGAGDAGDAGAPCTTTSCTGGVLTVCDGTGHTEPPVDCGAPALCDMVGQRCNDFGRLSVGTNRVCAVDDNHGVHCWGYNGGAPTNGGSLVLNDIHAMFVSPQTISGVSAWQIAVGDTFQCALQQNGDVSCWGVGGYGELGTTPSGVAGSNPSVPLALPAVEIGAAQGCGCARLNDGSVWCWGLEDQGCHGDAFVGGTGGQTAGPTPSQIQLPAKALQISVGDGKAAPSCARLVGGGVYCWGQGYGPTAVPVPTDALDITVGDALVFVRTLSGVLWSTPTPPTSADGGALTFSTPVAVTGTASATLIAGGSSFCSAGTGTTVTCTPLYDGEAPVQGLEASVSVVAPGALAELRAGYAAADFFGATVQCLRLSGVPFSESVYCWGADANGVIGVGGPGYFTAPQAVTQPSISTLRCGNYSTVAVLSTDGSARYWGSGTTYISNDAESDSPSAMLTELGTGNTWVQANDDTQYAYGLKATGGTPTLIFNGNTVTNQRLLAYASPSFTDALPAFVDIGLTKTQHVVVYADPPNGSGLQANGCGIFGDGTQTTPASAHNAAVTIPGGALITAIAAYVDPTVCPSHACAIDTTGVLWCWGSNDTGESGLDTAPPTGVVTSPTQVSLPNGNKVVSVAKGLDFTCATDGVAGAGQVYCWGNNDYGQLGDAASPDYTYYGPSPKLVLGLGAKAVGVTAGYDHACAWLADGTAACWGSNDYGQLGIGSFDDKGSANAVTGVTGVTSMCAGTQHTCALGSHGAQCWGSSYVGQVGIGVDGQIPAPTLVQGLP
jgi:alpha-tubulin suppressor-like RCC1 family protein